MSETRATTADVEGPKESSGRAPGCENSGGSTRALFSGRHGVVPYIVPWSEEVLPRTPVIQTGYGIGYPDETLFDRDDRGVLWNRAPSRRGEGGPFYGGVHPSRQRRAMLRLLCQVCAGPADHNGLGTLWLLRDERDDWAGWPEEMGNAHPPLCLPCARIAVKACPWLRPGYAAVRARSTITGVSGAVYQAGHPFPEFVEIDTVAYGGITSRWVQAGQLVRTIHDCKLVGLW